MPQVSILIPCYNAERWVAEAIQSALDQTHEDKEVIVIDDGSTDNSINVIKTFGDRIRWQTQPNRGGNYTRNRLLEMASGEWVQFLDADDYLLPTKIENQLQIFGIDTFDAVYGPTVLEWIHDDAVCDRDISTPDPDATIFEHWLNWQLGQTGTLIWRRDSLSRIGGWKESQPCCQDNEITFRALKTGFRFGYCPSPGNVYRLFEEGTLTKRAPLNILDEKAVLIRSMLDWLDTTGELTPQLLTLANTIVFQMARTAATFNSLAGVTREKEWRSQRLISTCPQIYPLSYRAIYQLFGFRSAELAARAARVLQLTYIRRTNG
ncbi:glycosyltransferase family 2 protein [Rubinisphaera sp. JC750]|uniref:glycosyltransferase family 2 protein n=1 Tax=Rubinisphaera sp. JC750 TaxID=2898658 RepID=UPI001F1BAD94|nr:glycosyltransferase [Rubinisphaera sp. JC750]